MSSFSLEFAVTCETNFGEKVCICGNLSPLGTWNPAFGLILETDTKSYPLWTTPAPVTIKYPPPHPGKAHRSSSNSAYAARKEK